MRILIFGEKGQLARALREEAAAQEIVALGRAQADLAVPGAAARAVKAHAPDVVINAAAYTAVDAAEEDKNAAMRVNGDAVGEIAAAARDRNAAFIHVSTDYVFSGEASRPYREDDETAPANVYGETKRAGEIAALGANAASVVLRTSWVFSEYGNNFVASMLRLGAERGEMNVVDDQIGGPTPARDLARAILAVAGKKFRGAPGDGIYHYQGAPAASWAGFAAKIFEYANMKTTVRKIPSTDYQKPARRPLYTVLDCARMERDFGVAQPDWRIGLRAVVSALAAPDKNA
jgi:dTDP-4-dehydrorhamnose reductase